MRWSACSPACPTKTIRAFLLSRRRRGHRITAPAGDEHWDSEDVMSTRFPRLGAFAIAAAMQVGLAGLAFAQGGASSGAPGQPQGYAGGAPGQTAEPAPSAQSTPGTELPVLYVT